MSLRNCSGGSSQVWNDDPPYLEPPTSGSSSVQTSVYIVSSAFPDKILCASRLDANVWLAPVIARADPYCQWQQIGEPNKFVLYNTQKHQAVTYSGGAVSMKDLQADTTGDEQYSEWNGSGLGPYQDSLRWLDAEKSPGSGVPATDPLTTQSWRVVNDIKVLSWSAVPVPVVNRLGQATTTLAANAPGSPASSPAAMSGLVAIRSGRWADYILCADPADQQVHLRYSPSSQIPDQYCAWQHIGRMYGDGSQFALYNPMKSQVMAYEGGDVGPLVMENPAFPAGNDQYFSIGNTEDWGARALQSFLDSGQNVDAKASGSDDPRPATDPVHTRGWRNGYQQELTWNLQPTGSYSLPRGTDCASTSITSVANQHYVSAELGYSGDQSGMLRARSTGIGPWEQFDLCRSIRFMPTGSYAIRSANSNQYITAVDSNNPPAMLRVARDTISTDEEFYITRTNDGTYALSRARNMSYVTAQLDYSGAQYGMLRAHAGGIGPWEQFQ
ncbi:fascin domain-containing protein [Streptomyces mirabilis]